MENENQEEMSMEEVVNMNDAVLNALIDLLIEKNIITEEELQKKLDAEGE